MGWWEAPENKSLILGDDEILADFEEKEIKQIILKIAKRPKRQKPKPGDIFCFKFDDSQFGFGCVVSKVSIGLVVEIFDYFSKQPVFDYSKADKWLIDPIIINGFSLFEQKMGGDWRIIGQTPGHKPAKEFENIRFVFGDGIGGNLKVVDIFDNEHPISLKETKGLHEYISSRNHKVIKLVKEALVKK